MSKTKAYARLFFLTSCWACLYSCGEKAKEDCTGRIREEIRPGVSLETAEAKLKECGFKTTRDHVRNILHGDKVKEGNPVAERTQVVVEIGPDGKVVQVRVSSGLIGP